MSQVSPSGTFHVSAVSPPQLQVSPSDTSHLSVVPPPKLLASSSDTFHVSAVSPPQLQVSPSNTSQQSVVPPIQLQYYAPRRHGGLGGAGVSGHRRGCSNWFTLGDKPNRNRHQNFEQVSRVKRIQNFRCWDLVGARVIGAISAIDHQVLKADVFRLILQHIDEEVFARESVGTMIARRARRLPAKASLRGRPGFLAPKGERRASGRGDEGQIATSGCNRHMRVDSDAVGEDVGPEVDPVSPCVDTNLLSPSSRTRCGVTTSATAALLAARSLRISVSRMVVLVLDASVLGLAVLNFSILGVSVLGVFSLSRNLPWAPRSPSNFTMHRSQPCWRKSSRSLKHPQASCWSLRLDVFLSREPLCFYALGRTPWINWMDLPHYQLFRRFGFDFSGFRCS
ncbi:hypothetical protein FIBSPDRAFT_928541 [Athelia psychrophila]|uniref:Uncharacterized protein n=1 Tax=Athelia psychrophila TaxID=1759441 RepID=A0A166PYQ9_9AGAM|nr:hypothetical protein FIBSPDRAFT_928541 [Fibularhizoctonia sp. CBS 109695]